VRKFAIGILSVVWVSAGNASLECDGFYGAGFYDTSFYADGFYFEASCGGGSAPGSNVIAIDIGISL
jgi:hypothetical protein